MFTTRTQPMVLAICMLILAATSFAADPVELISAADAAKLIGQPVSGPIVIGPEPDEDAPAQATHWTYRAKDSAVVVSRLDFASAAEARKYATPTFIKMQNDEDDAEVAEETGMVGEKAFWSVTEDGCALSFLKGSHIASVALGGRDIGPAESHKAALKVTALAIAAKL